MRLRAVKAPGRAAWGSRRQLQPLGSHGCPLLYGVKIASSMVRGVSWG